MATQMATAKRRLLIEAEAAEFLQVKPHTLAVWRGKGKGPRFCKIGGLVRYREQDLEEWVEQQASVCGCTIGAAPAA